MSARGHAPAQADWGDALLARLGASRATFGAPLRPLTTLRVGGPAECLVEVEREDDLLAVLELIQERELPYFVLGRGSNLLVPDAGLPGMVIRLGRGMAAMRREGNRVSSGAGAANGAFVAACRGWELGGMEFLIAVPGSIGGAIAMNAGAHGGETGPLLRAVRYVEMGKGMVTQDAAAIPFGYRHSPLRGQAGRLVVEGEFALQPTAPEEIAERISACQTYRRETQPRDFPNCGSVFQNPPGDFAARLIEQCGLKGHRLGAAQVSEKHANFIVNRDGAAAAEVTQLIDLIRETVYHQTQVELELELQVL